MDALNMVRTPADQIPVSPRQDWVARFAIKKPFLDWGAFGQPRWTATTVKTVRVFPRPGYAQFGHFDKVPDLFHYPPGFQASTGDDNQADVAWSGGWDGVWGYRTKATSSWSEWAYFRLANLFKGMTDYDAVAGSLGHIGINQQGNAGFYCPGVPPGFCVPTADQFEAGLIDHVVGLTMTFSMGGTVAPRTILDVNHPDIGTKYKAACAPALIIEGGSNPQTDPTKGVMMGQRFRLNWTNTQLNTWAMTKPPASRTAAVTLGRALIDYGITPAQSGPNDLIPLDSNQKARYVKAGVTQDLLDGIDWAALVALDPPKAVYSDGTTGNREGSIKTFSY